MAAPAGELEWAWLVNFRRALHKHPEPGFMEVHTRAAIRHALITRASIAEEVVDAHPPMGTPHGTSEVSTEGCSATGEQHDSCPGAFPSGSTVSAEIG